MNFYLSLKILFIQIHLGESEPLIDEFIQSFKISWKDFEEFNEFEIELCELMKEPMLHLKPLLQDTELCL